MEDHPVFALISDQQEVDSLAGGLADEYVQFFDINTNQEEKNYQDAIEECLAHLEEVSSTLDDLVPIGPTIDVFVATVDGKRGALRALYDKVDAIEQYIFEKNKILDQLESELAELEHQQSSKAGRIKQIIDLIPRVSIMSRLNIFKGP